MVLAACTYGSLQVLINNKPINTPLVIILASCGLMAKISIEERMALIKRNSAEIVTEEELLQLLQGKKKPVVYRVGEGKYFIDLVSTFKNFKKD